MSGSSYLQKILGDFKEKHMFFCDNYCLYTIDR